MPRQKRPGLTGAALEKAVKAFPKEEREKWRKLLAPLPTASEIMRRDKAAIKKSTTQQQRQAVLDDVRAGVKFGDIATKHGLTAYQVALVMQMNEKRHVYTTLNEVSV